MTSLIMELNPKQMTTTYSLTYNIEHTIGEDPIMIKETGLTTQQASSTLYALSEGDFGCNFTHLKIENEQTLHILTKEETNELTILILL